MTGAEVHFVSIFHWSFVEYFEIMCPYNSCSPKFSSRPRARNKKWLHFCNQPYFGRPAAFKKRLSTRSWNAHLSFFPSQPQLYDMPSITDRMLETGAFSCLKVICLMLHARGIVEIISRSSFQDHFSVFFAIQSFVKNLNNELYSSPNHQTVWPSTSKQVKHGKLIVQLVDKLSWLTSMLNFHSHSQSCQSLKIRAVIQNSSI